MAHVQPLHGPTSCAGLVPLNNVLYAGNQWGKCFLGCRGLFLLQVGYWLKIASYDYSTLYSNTCCCAMATVCFQLQSAVQLIEQSKLKDVRTASLFSEAVLPVGSIFIVAATDASWVVQPVLLTQRQAKGSAINCKKRAIPPVSVSIT